MKNFIQNLEKELSVISDWDRQQEIIDILLAEKTRAERILRDYKDREINYWVYSPDACKYEKDIVNKVWSIINNIIN